MPNLVLAGICWACGAGSFAQHCPALPPPEGWYDDAMEELRAQGWVFLEEGPGKLRAYCKACWDKTEG